MQGTYLPHYAMEKILKQSGAVRVSDTAAIVLRETVVERAFAIAKRAVLLAEHAGRRTILADDIKLAAKK